MLIHKHEKHNCDGEGRDKVQKALEDKDKDKEGKEEQQQE